MKTPPLLLSEEERKAIEAELHSIYRTEIPALRAELTELVALDEEERPAAAAKLAEKLDQLELELLILNSVGKNVGGHVAEFHGRDAKGHRIFRVLKVQ